MVIDHGRGTFDVDVVDGVLIAMSSIAMGQLRFDAGRFTGFHSYNCDIRMQDRSAGLCATVAELDVFHDSYPNGKITDMAAWNWADRIWRRKWHWTLADRVAYFRSVLTSGILGPRG